MRSRDGNFNLLLSVSVVFFLFFPLALNAREYLISYRYLVKNIALYNETLMVSKAMRKCDGTPYNPIYLDTNHKTDLKQIIKKNNEKFIEYIHELGLNLVHKDTTRNFEYSSTTMLTLKTRCFEVDFNDNVVKISPLK